MSYAYDDAGLETSITYPGGSNQVAYAYDSANRLSTVTGWNSNATSYANANRLTGTTHVKNGGTLASASYAVCRLTSVTENVPACGVHNRGGQVVPN